MIAPRVEEVIDRSSEEVARFIFDLTNFPKWDRNVHEARITSEGPTGVGTTGQAVVQQFGRYVVDVRITEYEPNRKFAFEFISGPLKGTKQSYTIESVGGNRTRLTRSTQVELQGSWKLLSLFQPIVLRMVKREDRDDLANAKRVLQPQA